MTVVRMAKPSREKPNPAAEARRNREERSWEHRDPGPLPTLKWLDKDCFVVDVQYQRSVESRASQASITQIAENFTWSRFSPPTVTPDKGGDYIVIDGQHRVEAARRRPDIKLLPAYVVPAMTRREQAEAFVGINQNRVALTPLAIFRAQLAMGDPEACRVRDVCAKAEVSIAKYPLAAGLIKPRETLALGAIKTGLRDHGDAPVVAALRIIPSAFPEKGGMMRAGILTALMEFCRARGAQAIDQDAISLILQRRNPVQRELDAKQKAQESVLRWSMIMLHDLNRDYEAQVKSGNKR